LGHAHRHSRNNIVILDKRRKLNLANASAPAGINDGIGQTTNPMCDPTRGFSFDQTTMNSFGKVINKHGHRRIELALKFYF
jgi:hypothetical protein